MQYPDYPKEGNNDACLEIAPGVWVMDDHKWALWVWATHRDTLGKTLFHVDYHWDGADDFSGDEDSLIGLLSDPKALKKVISEDRMIRKDSFISPAVRGHFFKDIHFYCYQRNIEPGLNPEILIHNRVRQYIHPDISTALNYINPVDTALDLDVDIFNRSTYFGHGDVWANDEILSFLDTLKDLVQKAPLITIALSYCYSGTEADTHRLAELILPWILSIRA
jgi:hypothetical protein